MANLDPPAAALVKAPPDKEPLKARSVHRRHFLNDGQAELRAL
uniref:Uncharacterized protein n=1 Tax=Arundo donax TaxID=35708 RepID=A0A0A9EED9_ARUDO